MLEINPRGTRLCFLCLWITTSCVVAQEPDRLFSNWDKNRDGVLVPSEVPEGPRKIFAAVDRNGDGKVTLSEHKQGPDRNKLRQLERNERPAHWPAIQDAKVVEFSIRQTWHQEPDGFDRPVLARVPTKTEHVKKLPVVIYFHGNGGQATRAINNWRELNPCIFVAPQGYERSWNIHGEKSEAPIDLYQSQAHQNPNELNLHLQIHLEVE